jgi:penicillin-binding protein 1A
MGRLAWQVGRALVLFLFCTTVVPVVVAVVILGTLLFAPLPASLPEARSMALSRASRVLDAQGNEIGVFKAFEQNVPVQKQDIPLVLKQAVVAAEDSRFYQHSGVDIQGSARALLNDLQGNSTLQGGSTITQQYVKLTYTSGDRTLARKVKEAILASQLARKIDKDEILFRYMSIISLGEGTFGVGAASETYFRKEVSALSASEAATLAGVIPAPTFYSPRDHPDRAEQKRVLVLDKMLDQGYLTPEQHADAVRAKLVLADKPANPKLATVVYPRQQPQSRYPYFVDYVRRFLVNKYGEDMVFRGGLTIQTTIEPDLQAKAEAQVANALAGTKPYKEPKKNGDPNLLNMTLVSVEPATGRVKALVGGRDPNDPYIGKVNRALGRCPPKPPPAEMRFVEVPASCWNDQAPVEGGGSGDQPGSAFKAFTLAAAFRQGISPNRSYSADAPYRVPGCTGDKCVIKNSADGEGGGSLTLTQATAGSVNVVFARLAHDIGNKAIGQTAVDLGMSQVWESTRVHGASYTLGTIDVSSLEMAAAYSVFANRGVRVPATPIIKIVDPTGKVVEDNLQPVGQKVLEEGVADTMNSVLKGPLESGTARGKGIGRPAAGKTGSTNDNFDAWFVGYTPNLSTAVSMGYDEGKPMLGIKGVSTVFGGTIPASTWQAYMQQALDGVPPTDFNAPPPVGNVEDEAARALRGGIDAGVQRPAITTPPGGPYEIGITPPKPTTPQRSVPPAVATIPASSTTTVRRPTTILPPFGPRPP